MRLLICAGGTGGGVYPALSVLQALQHESSQVLRDEFRLEALWVGGEGGLEADLVKRVQVAFESIPAAGVHGVGVRSLPGNLVRLGRGIRAARRILHDVQPEVLLFTGGYVAVPMAFAARVFVSRHNRPKSLVYIPDIEPGWALKALTRMADHVALTVEESEVFLPPRVPRSVTGYPLRQELVQVDRSSSRETLGFEGDLPVFLVMGGSRGARSINQALFAVLPQLLDEMQVLHISGQQAWEGVEKVRSALPQHTAGRYHPYPYLHAEMGVALAAADLVLSRAGASSLGEYPAFGLPALLAPYPYAWRYQRVNAQYLVDRGAALMIQDGDLESLLLPKVQELMRDLPLRKKMAEAMGLLAKPDAAQSIAKILISMSGSGH